MKAKDFLNFKKPHFWVALVVILLLIFAGIVAVLDKEPLEEAVDVPPAEEIEVEVEVDEAEKKTDREIIMERFMGMDWEEAKKNAKSLDEEGWEDGIVFLGGLSSEKIALYGYNDQEYKLRGVAVEHGNNVSFFDWIYYSDANVSPQMYWNGEKDQLQITLHNYGKDEIHAPELHVLVEHDTKTMEDFVYRAVDYLMEIEDQLAGTGVEIGAYVDIKLGNTMMLEFKPIKIVDGEETVLKKHQAIIYLNQSKDGFVFELGDVGVEPEKRTAVIKIEDVEENYTEVQYISKNGYTLWYPETMTPVTIHGHEGFTNLTSGDETASEVIIVPEGDMSLDEEYLKEAADNFKASGEYKKVTISKIKTLKSEDKNVKIKMIEVVHDETAHRFYMVKGQNQAVLITVSLQKEALKDWGVRISQMIQTITFQEDVEETVQ